MTTDHCRYYIMEIKKYGPDGYKNMQDVYSYHIADESACWLWMIMIAIVFRTFAYLALVRQEE